MPRLDAKATERPWSVQRKREVCPESHDLFIVAYTSGADQSEAEANAAFIVRACNAHDSLVAALTALDEYYGASGKVWAEARAALKLAE